MVPGMTGMMHLRVPRRAAHWAALGALLLVLAAGCAAQRATAPLPATTWGLCNGQADPPSCAAEDCANPLTGTVVRQSCPAKCGTCEAGATKPEATFTTLGFSIIDVTAAPVLAGANGSAAGCVDDDSAMEALGLSVTSCAQFQFGCVARACVAGVAGARVLHRAAPCCTVLSTALTNCRGAGNHGRAVLPQVQVLPEARGLLRPADRAVHEHVLSPNLRHVRPDRVHVLGDLL